MICATRVPTTDEEEWGGDAGIWNPDRFLEGKRGNMNPFGGGVSMCEGKFAFLFFSLYLALSPFSCSTTKSHNPEHMISCDSPPRKGFELRISNCDEDDGLMIQVDISLLPRYSLLSLLSFIISMRILSKIN